MLTLNPRRHIVKADGKPVRLTPKEFLIAQYALENKGYIITRDDIMRKVWGITTEEFASRSVDQHIARLRKRVGKSRRFLTTVPGFGYRADDGEIQTD